MKEFVMSEIEQTSTKVAENRHKQISLWAAVIFADVGRAIGTQARGNLAQSSQRMDIK
jgi:hypothetical protein